MRIDFSITYLICDWFYCSIVYQPLQLSFVEIGDANRSCEAFFVYFFKCFPRVYVVDIAVERLAVWAFWCVFFTLLEACKNNM